MSKTQLAPYFRAYFIAPFLFWLGILTSYSQNQGIIDVSTETQAKVDSLNRAYRAAEHDTDKINCLFALGETLIGPDPDTCLITNKRVLELAEQNLTAGTSTSGGQAGPSLKRKYLLSLAGALNNIGYIYQIKGDIDKGLEYFHKSLKIKEELSGSPDEATAKAGKKGVANSLINIGYVYQNKGEIDKGLEYYLKSLKIYEELGDSPDEATAQAGKKGMAYSLNNIGAIYYYKGDIGKGLEYYHKSFKINEEIDDKKGMAYSLNNIGAIYYYQGDVAQGLKYYYKSLKIEEEIGDKKGVANSLNNIGAIYEHQGDIAKGLEYYHKSLNIYEGIGNKKGVAESLNNIGYVHKNQGDIAKGLEYYNKGLKLREEIGDKKGVAYSLNNIGAIYEHQGDIAKGLEYYHKSLKIYEEIEDKKGAAESLNNIGYIYLGKGKLSMVKEYAERSMKLAEELGFPENIRNAAELLSKTHRKEGNFKQAIEMYELYIQMRDSIKNEETQKASIKQQFKYDYEKREAVANARHQAELERQEAVAAEEQKKQNVIIGSVSGGLGLVLLFSIFLFNRFRVIQRQKGIIEEQKEEVDKAYDSLEEKNKEITDSINYAQRIQAAILPPDRIVKQYLKDSFVLYKPKDIVAGDFYWMESYAPPVVGASDSEGKGGEHVIFAAADCTGHGVPGAMLSMLCNNALNRSVREYGLTDPGKILDKTREIIIAEFEKSDEDVKDGMDISLCALNGYKLQFAGAYNLLWIIRNGEVIEIKGDRQPIGNSDNPLPFTTHLFDLEKGDVFYIFSDGYVDQFGGEKGKKLKAKAFRELLLSVVDKPMDEQIVLLDEAFEKWRGNLEQVDDVCVIGVKI